MSARQGALAGLVRTLGFVRKELWTVLRQPRLIMTLVVGPFLILLVFGFGYTEKVDPLRTLIVVGSEEAELAADVDDLGDAFGSSIDLVGTTADPAGGMEQLERGEIDLLIIAPEDPLGSLDAGEKADFTVVHREVDPIIQRSIDLLADLSVNEINRRVLATFVEEAQEGSEEVDDPVVGLSAGADALVAALEAGDDDAARDAKLSLEDQLRATADQVPEGGLYGGIGRILGVSAGTLAGDVLTDLDGTDPSDPDAVENARRVASNLETLETGLGQARELDPLLVVSPFGAEVEALNETPPVAAIFYAPGVLMLLVQHLAVTFAALSLVRERQLGITEVFRVSPLSVTEAMVGKYVAFTIIVGSVSAALSGLMLVFGVPLAGAPAMYAAIVVLVLLASLGLGFVISAVSESDSQAIQYSMIVLLVSIFFSGFIIPLDRLLAPVHAVSYLLPATYGVSALQDVVFRDATPSVLITGGLALYVAVGAAATWIMARRDIAH